MAAMVVIAQAGSMVAIMLAGSMATDVVMAPEVWMVLAEGGLHGQPGAMLALFAV